MSVICDNLAARELGWLSLRLLTSSRGTSTDRGSRAQEETFEAGHAYYVPPGHTPTIYAGTEVVEFSPSEELAQTMKVVQKNVEAAGRS